MDKWADYLISQASYDSNRLISNALRHKDTNNGITKGIQVDRISIISDIKNGLSYITIYSNNNSWKKGYKIKRITIDDNHYLRIDENKAKLDYFGDLPEVSTNINLEKLPLTEPDAIPKLHKALPKESSQEIPQLESQPETEPDEATPEQLLRLEQLEEQIRVLESQPETEPDEATPEQLLRLEQLEEQIRVLSRKINSN